MFGRSPGFDPRIQTPQEPDFGFDGGLMSCHHCGEFVRPGHVCPAHRDRTDQPECSHEYVTETGDECRQCGAIWMDGEWL